MNNFEQYEFYRYIDSGITDDREGTETHDRTGAEK